MAQLSCENVILGYGNHPIVSNLNFSVNKGDYLCIIGENGSGKSSLIKTILHLQPPMSGKVSTGDGLKQSEIGYLPQQTEMQKDFPSSVMEIVLSGCLNGCGLRPFYNKEEKLRAKNNLIKLSISDLAKRCYRELSGGQQQKVLLARALCATKKMLLLDEPVSGLDPLATEKMYELIYKINKEDGITIIMVTHDIPAAERYATHILHVNNSPVFGTKKEYFHKSVEMGEVR